MSRHSDWLLDELPRLQAQGVLDEAAAARLRAHYAQAGEQGLGWGMIALAAGGAALIALGIILIFAHNWENWTPELRVALSIAPLLLGQLACWQALRNRSRLWSEAAGSFTALAIGAAIALVAQTYQFGGDLPRFLLTWTLLALPLVYLLDSSAVAVLCWLGTLGWALTGNENPWWAWGDRDLEWLRLPQFLVLMALPLPHLLRHLRSDQGFARAAWMLRVALPVFAGGYALVQKHHDGALLLFYGALSAAAVLAGRRWLSGLRGIWGNPLQGLGLLGLLIVSLAATVGELWREVRLPEPGLLALPVVFSATAIVLAARLAATGDRTLPAAVAALPLVLWILEALAPYGASWPQLLGHLYVLALAAALIRTGLHEARLGLANSGLSLVTALVMLRFFDSDLSYVLRGVGFIVTGLAFFAAVFWLRRRVRGSRA